MDNYDKYDNALIKFDMLSTLANDNMSELSGRVITIATVGNPGVCQVNIRMIRDFCDSCTLNLPNYMKQATHFNQVYLIPTSGGFSFGRIHISEAMRIANVMWKWIQSTKNKSA